MHIINCLGMSFLNKFIDPLRNHYVDFSGTATRSEYWVFVLMFVVLMVVVSVIEVFLGISFVSIVLYVIFLMPTLALTTRRLHDSGLSGWWQLLNIVPFIGWFILIILLLRRTKSDGNKYVMVSSTFTPGTV